MSVELTQLLVLLFGQQFRIATRSIKSTCPISSRRGLSDSVSISASICRLRGCRSDLPHHRMARPVRSVAVRQELGRDLEQSPPVWHHCMNDGHRADAARFKLGKEFPGIHGESGFVRKERHLVWLSMQFSTEHIADPYQPVRPLKMMWRTPATGDGQAWERGVGAASPRRKWWSPKSHDHQKAGLTRMTALFVARFRLRGGRGFSENAYCFAADPSPSADADRRASCFPGYPRHWIGPGVARKSLDQVNGEIRLACAGHRSRPDWLPRPLHGTHFDSPARARPRADLPGAPLFSGP